MDITVIGRGNVAKGTVQKENAHWAFLIQHLVEFYNQVRTEFEHEG